MSAYVHTDCYCDDTFMAVLKCNHVHSKRIPVKNNYVPFEKDTIFTVKSLQTLVYFSRESVRTKYLTFDTIGYVIKKKKIICPVDIIV